MKCNKVATHFALLVDLGADMLCQICAPPCHHVRIFTSNDSGQGNKIGAVCLCGCACLRFGWHADWLFKGLSCLNGNKKDMKWDMC